ncbi:uncharacterized protein LOC126426603 [Schistocerca serialis cubense]|uniref:uncharacterized protein LOC126426603 n=1 Tax=Schistocerca serialis cubense TaxID=2023355 RepID=UPI00214EA19D|nr:uncharacterized protein LOC126426603 [Schistocerca serialis cubense]
MSADLVASEVGSGDPAETDSTPTSADRRGDGTGTAGGGTALDGGVIGAGEGQCSGSASSARTARKRPQFSYTELSAMAIAQSPHRRAKLSEMYAYIMSRFPYYRRKKFWQKAFSNNLSRSKCFVNVPLEGDKQKGNYWMLDPKYEAVLEKGNFHHRHEELPFLGSPAVSVPLRRQRHGTGLSEHPQVPESGGCGVGDAAAPLPSYQHYSRPAQICDGSDSASFEESNLQNVTRDELLMAQEMSTHFISCSDPTRDSASFEGSSFQNVTHNELVTAREMSTHFISCSTPTRGIITREDNSFCSTDNIDGPSDDSHPICDLQNVKVEVVEDPLTVPWFNGCFKEDPDTYLGVNATESEEEARGRHTPDVTRESTDALTSTGLSVAEVGSTGRTAPVSPHLGGSHSHSHRHGHDATPWMSNPGTPTFATCDTTNDSGDRTDVDSREIGTGCVAGGAAEKRRLGNTGSASAANTKPQFSYKSVIASAIAQSPHRRLTLSEIYAYIASHFPYLRGKKKRMWKNSVRCCLWYHKCFVKVPQEGGGDKAKCCNYWTLDPRYEEVSENGKFRHRSEKWLFRRSPAASPSVRRVHAHHSRHRYPGDRPQRQPLSGPSAHSQLPETATSAATATWSGLLVSDADSTVRAAPDPPHPGSSHLEGTVPASDATVPTDCAATQNSPSGGTGNGRDRRASTVGGPASGAGQKRSSDDTGSASIARSKPPFQYEELIAMAILKSPHRRATLSEIKAYIASRFPYFERSEKRWQKSVHCKLFFSDFFVKVPLAVRYRRGKQCNLWMLDPRYENMFRNGNLQRFRLVKQPSSRSRGIRGKGGRVGVRAVPSCAPPHSARYEHSTDPATHHSSRSRDGCCQDDSPTSDAAATPGDAAASTSASSGSDIDTVGTATGKAADGAGEERHPSVAGLAGTAEKKPPFSYTELSAMAIADSPHRRAKLSEIFAYVTSRFPYYELGKVVWQRALSVNLSRSKCFVNVWHGSSTYWMLNRRYEDIMEMGRLRRQHVKRAFFGGPTAAVGARRVPTRHSLRKRRNWRRHTGLSEEQSRLPESGAGGSGAGAAVSGTEPPPASPHCTRSTRLSDGNDSASFEESNLQNVTHDESIMAQERLTHFASCRVMTQGITTEEDNSFCSTNNSEALAGGPLTVSDPQSIKKEVFEDPLAVSTFSRCIKEDPDLHFEVDATDNEEEATRGHASDVTCAATLTSTGLSVNDIGGNGPAAPDTSLCSNAHGKDDVALRDVTVLTDGAGTPTFTFSGTATSSDGGTDTCVGRSAGRSAAGGAHEERRLRDASSVGPADSKLQFSYKDTIAAAIAQSPHRRLTVPEIYAYITSHFPNFRGKKKIWRNSVRWCLWYHKCFVKVPLEGGDDKARCCNYWTLDPQYEDVFENGNFQRQQHTKRPFSWSRGVRSRAGVRGVHAVPSSAYLQSTRHERSTGRATRDPSRPGTGSREDDVLISDTTASAVGVPTLAVTFGGTADSVARGTVADSGTAAGDGAAGAAGDTGSPCTADVKPPFSYTELNAMAIMHSPHRRATLSEIYTYVTSRFPYCKRNKKFWQRALSNNLCRNECFVYAPQEGAEQKGSCWKLDPQYEDAFENGKFRHWQQRHRAGLSVQSGAIGSGVVGIGSGAVPHPGDMQCASSPAEDDRGTDRRSGHPERDGPDARDDDSSRRTAAAKWEVSGGNDGGAVRPALDCEEAFARGQNPERRGHGGCGHTSVSRSACHRVFERRGISNRHVRLHAGERPYDCHVCHKTFVRSSNLREHLLLHTGQRPYRCSFCLKAFTASSKLRKHLRVHANCATSAVRGSGGDTSEVRVECQDRDVSSP